MSTLAFPLDDPSNPQPVQNAATPNDPSQSASAPVANTTAPASSAPVASTPQQQSQQQPAPSQQTAPKSSQPAQTQQPSQDGTVSNISSLHPAVAKAGVLRQVAEVLAGGPRYATTIDPSTGATVQTRVPLTSRDIGMAIALEAVSGGIAGLSQTGPNALGRAAAAGYQQVQQQTQAAQKAQQDAAQQQFNNQTKTLAQRASIFSQNQQSIIAAQQAERLGIENVQSYVDSQAPILQQYQDAGAVSEQHVTAADIQAGLKNGTYQADQVTSIPDGFIRINGRPELTYAIVNQPQSKLSLTQDMVNELSARHVPGFPKGMRIPGNGVQVSGYVLTQAYSQLASNRMTLQEASDVSRALSQSDDPQYKEMASSIPDFNTLLDNKDQGPVLQRALAKLPKYMHHDGSGDDFAQALFAMSQPTRPNPSNPKQIISNAADQSAAQTIASAFGNGNPQRGYAVLSAYNKLMTPAPVTSEAQAEAVLADPDSSMKAKMQAQQYLTVSRDQKASDAKAEAQARAQVEQTAAAAKGAASGNTSDVASIGESLARGALTEDMVPGFGKIKSQVQAYLSEHHPNLDQSSLQMTSEERKRADLARNAITNLDRIQNIVQRRPDLVGVVQGRVSQGKELTGTDDRDLTSLATALDNYSLASTGAHGVRAVEARQTARQAVLNGFKNGLNGIAGAVDTAKQSLQEFASAGKPRGIDGSPYIYRTGSGQPTSNGQQNGSQPPTGLTNFQVNKQTGQRIGWNGSAWVDAKTGQKVQ